MREMDRALWQYSKEINEETGILPEIKEEIVEKIDVLARSAFPNG